VRETAQAYYIDIELPGLHNASAPTVDWRSDHKLLVEGSLERPSIAKPKGSNGTENAHDLEESATNEAPSYIVADEANGFEPNEDLYPSDCVGTTQRPTDVPSSYVVRDEANGFEPNEDLYPSDNVSRAQLEQVVSENPATRPKVPQYIIAKGGNGVGEERPHLPT
jgi:hypothetical protein